MESTTDLAALAAAMRAAQSHQEAVAQAVGVFAEQLYRAVAAAAQELVAQGAPGVGLPVRVSAGRYERLRLGWGEQDLVFVPLPGAKLPPGTERPAEAQPLGRLILFHTARGEEHHGLPIRDYFIAADGAWQFSGLGGPAAGPALDEAGARQHVLSLFNDLHARLRSAWIEPAQITVMSEEGDDRAIGFLVDEGA